MVRIVTGKINSYKTSRIRAYYERTKQGDGFICLKTMTGDLVHHYDLLRLSTQKTRPFIVRDIFYDHTEDIRHQIGPYMFYEAGFQWVEKVIDNLIQSKVQPIYLDEIGILELKGQGFHKLIKKVLDHKLDLCLVVRKDLLEQFIKQYHIKDYEIIGD